MLVTITDFAESRNTDRDTVNAFIRNHPEIKAQTRREGKNVVIDTASEAFSLLDKQYPLPQMVQVIEDTESRQKLIKAQEMIIQLQGKLNEQSQLIAQAEATKVLLEDKQIQLAKAQQEADKARNEAIEARKEAKAMIDRAEEEKADLRQQLEAERAKTWWQKFRGK